MSLTALTSAEISLPAEADGARVSDRIAVLADTVDVVGLTDNHAGQPRMSPLAAVALAREQRVGTIVHVSCRDRNRLALQSQVVGAAAFVIPVPRAPGTAVKENNSAVIDFSNARDGYVMVKFHNSTTNTLATLIDAPGGTQYVYMLTPGNFAVYPLSEGNGRYTIGVYEQIQGTRFRLVIKKSIDVTLADSLAPFLRPNQYVNFNKDSAVVKKAAELTNGTTGMVEKISAVYNFVISNFTYDKELAATVQTGYLPDVDAVLARKKGICFDYTAVMTAMLRSQGIPTKLVIGYLGREYHAWIKVHSNETGWVNVIYFDGKNWRIMDPTFAAGRTDFIVDESKYRAMFRY